jgi:DNA mismatch endonuclease (patch repair protein)
MTEAKCTADVVFTKQRLCVFVDGCFWHGCPIHFRVPNTNRDWWAEKIQDNKQRDSMQSIRLRGAGWTVMRFWEHELEGPTAVERAALKVMATIRRLTARS